METEVMVVMMDGSQPESMVAVPEVAARPVLLVAPGTMPVVGQNEEVVA